MELRHINLHGNIADQKLFFVIIIQKAAQGGHFPGDAGVPVLLFGGFGFIVFQVFLIFLDVIADKLINVIQRYVFYILLG